jgi:hypothetical protein
MYRALCVDGPVAPAGEGDSLALADAINGLMVSSAALAQEARAEGLGAVLGDLDPNYFVYMPTLLDLLCEPAVLASEAGPPADSAAAAGGPAPSATTTPAKAQRERTLSTGEFVSTPSTQARI